MEEKIKSRIINRGDKNESSWPPVMPSEDKTPMYFDKEEGCMKPGYPPQTFVPFGQAPIYISDEMSATRHPASGQVITSKKAWEETDKVCGTITSGRPIQSSKQKELEKIEKRKKENREALHKAVAMLDSGTAPLTEEVRAKCEARNQQIAGAMPGFDPFNAVGRISDERGIRYKRKVRKLRKSGGSKA